MIRPESALTSARPPHGRRDRVLVVPTGSANLASVCAAIERLGFLAQLSIDPVEIEAARHVVLPGVGSFGAAMARLRASGADRALAARLDDGRSTLAVCLGLQLLCRGSAESPGVRGLGVIDAVVERLPSNVRVPHMGWNVVEPVAGNGVIEEGEAYFAHSYALAAEPPGWRVATTRHGGSFVAALERRAVVACQFHPELSGTAGLALMRRWLAVQATPIEETVPC